MFISSVRFRNPQVDLQAQDRAHRIGQKKEVQVFRFCTEVPIFFFLLCSIIPWLMQRRSNSSTLPFILISYHLSTLSLGIHKMP